jgi:hypothetical protein
MIHCPSSPLLSVVVTGTRDGRLEVCSAVSAGRSAVPEHPKRTRRAPPASDVHLPSCELTLILP